MLRSDRMIDIARQFRPGGTYKTYDETSVFEARDEILWLTKGCLKRVTAGDLARMKEAGNIVCADYVDDHEREALADVIDVRIAASIQQRRRVRKERPDTHVYLITHPVDARLAGVHCQQDHFSAGYFGELVNARHRAELEGVIDFVSTDTKTSEGGWLARLPDHNLHYAVRRPHRRDRHKPFLKGFTAAACGAVILTLRREGDARHYLGADYPFLVPDTTVEAIRETLRLAADAFGGPDWKRAQTTMASIRERSSDRHIASELAAFIEAVSA